MSELYETAQCAFKINSGFEIVNLGEEKKFTWSVINLAPSVLVSNYFLLFISESKKKKKKKHQKLIEFFQEIEKILTFSFCNTLIGNKTLCRPIRSVIILVTNKSESRCAVHRFCYPSYDYRPNLTPLSPITATKLLMRAVFFLK